MKKKLVSKPFLWLLGIFGAILLLAIAIPNIQQYRTGAAYACINNLRQLDGAKEQWQLEHKKTATDTPTWDDLIGTDKYIKTMPVCPKNGTFTIGSMAQKPTCSVPGHSLP